MYDLQPCSMPLDHTEELSGVHLIIKLHDSQYLRKQQISNQRFGWPDYLSGHLFHYGWYLLRYWGCRCHFGWGMPTDLQWLCRLPIRWLISLKEHIFIASKKKWRLAFRHLYRPSYYHSSWTSKEYVSEHYQSYYRTTSCWHIRTILCHHPLTRNSMECVRV